MSLNLLFFSKTQQWEGLLWSPGQKKKFYPNGLPVKVLMGTVQRLTKPTQPSLASGCSKDNFSQLLHASLQKQAPIPAGWGTLPGPSLLMACQMSELQLSFFEENAGHKSSGRRPLHQQREAGLTLAVTNPTWHFKDGVSCRTRTCTFCWWNFPLFQPSLYKDKSLFCLSHKQRGCFSPSCMHGRVRSLFWDRTMEAPTQGCVPRVLACLMI